MKIMKRLENHLKAIYERSERTLAGNNRTRAIRSLNEVLDTNLIKIELVKKGFVRETSNGFKWNIKVSGFGKNLQFYTNQGSGYIYPMTLLECVGKFLQKPEIREKILSTVHIPSPCYKCNGAGVIPAFYYYANGVCFDCMGSGVSREKLIVKIHETKES